MTEHELRLPTNLRGASAAVEPRLQSIQVALVRLLLENGRSGALVNFAVAALLTVLLWSAAVPRGTLIGWFGYLAVLAVIRAAIIRRALHGNLDAATAALWGRRYLAATTLVGLGWGSSAFLLYPPSLTHQTYFLIILAGLIAGAVPARMIKK